MTRSTVWPPTFLPAMSTACSALYAIWNAVNSTLTAGRESRFTATTRVGNRAGSAEMTASTAWSTICAGRRSISITMPELMKRIVDLSHVIGPATPVFPGDPPVDITVVESTQDPPLSERRRLNCSRIGLIVHVGTHMDAPFHFFEAGETIDRVPLDRCVGPAVLVDLRHLKASEEIGREHLQTHAGHLSDTGKAVLHTGWSKQWGKAEYFSEHP